MSAVRAAQSISPEPSALDADVQLMQDVLYDILATGVDPDQADAPSLEIEHFLFEHARAPKTAEEFRAFFAAHGLSVRARVSAARCAAIALPELTRPSADGMPARMPVELAPGGVERAAGAGDGIASTRARPGCRLGAVSARAELRRWSRPGAPRCAWSRCAAPPRTTATAPSSSCAAKSRAPDARHEQDRAAITALQEPSGRPRVECGRDRRTAAARRRKERVPRAVAARGAGQSQSPQAALSGRAGSTKTGAALAQERQRNSLSLPAPTTLPGTRSGARSAERPAGE